MKVSATIGEIGIVTAADDTIARSDSEKARALVRHLSAGGHCSTADILHELRRAFPYSPLSVRIAALKALREL